METPPPPADVWPGCNYQIGARQNGGKYFFTLAEIKTLRAVPPMPARPQEFNGAFERPTSSTPNARPV